MTTNTNNAAPTLHSDTPQKHRTAGDLIPAGNETPFSTTLEDLYHMFRGVRAGMDFTLEELLNYVNATKSDRNDAFHAIAHAMLDRFDVVLKELLWASNTMRQASGSDWIANEAHDRKHGRPAGEASK